MPNIKSAKKRNKMVKSALKTSIKKADTAITSAAPEKVEVYRVTVATIDKAVAKGILAKNTAARRKSQLAKKLNAAEA